MRTKVILFFVCLFLMLNSTAQALVTSDTQDSDDGVVGTWFVFPPTNHPDTNLNFILTDYYRFYNEDWDWTHNVTYEGYGPYTINSATLEIRAWDVDQPETGYPAGEVDEIYLDGHYIGDLDQGRSKAWGITTFTITDTTILAELLDGTALIEMDISTAESVGKYAVALDYSTLTVDYIPAPGAVLLAGFGAGLVGWLRRRRTL